MIRWTQRLAAIALLAACPSAMASAQAAPETPPVLEVSASTDLTEGQRIVVNGSGFRPGLAAVAVGLCKQNFANGLKDCDLEGGATFVNISDDGTFPTVTLSARHSFNAIDCTQQQCVIAAAPLPGTEPPAIIEANSAQVAVSFAGAQLPVPTAPVTGAATEATDTNGPSGLLWGVTAALLSAVAVIALADRRRL
ncbi:hypothetical protein HLB23_00970 [Nocardia uniformis]|uniref:Neocarzinostatin family protein n=1 Tax=Nocardia uniformis TaxID=53432 RepID=A0A849BTZ5_9NOCA|nr:neocarzinostatin apoprotein domain-containing protein [Nocardia uniformis]NNH68468.1 hypothetical protein [Nocardia uniformis]